MRRSRIPTRDESDRGQAYTLEGFAAAAVVLFALLFAMQSVVITPGTGGAIDRTAQAQIQQEAQDALVVAAHSNETERGNLSELVRYWAADGEIDASSPTGDFEERFVLGEVLGTHVSEAAYPDDYRVEFVYLDETENVTDPQYVAGTNLTDASAVTASYTVPVFTHQNTTEYDGSKIVETDREIPGDPDDPIPDVSGSNDPIHNVVEVRVIVW